jgi:hypothetical protein
MSSGDAAEPVLQPLDALQRVGSLPGGVLQQDPEPVDVHAGNSKQPPRRLRLVGTPIRTLRSGMPRDRRDRTDVLNCASM